MTSTLTSITCLSRYITFCHVLWHNVIFNVIHTFLIMLLHTLNANTNPTWIHPEVIEDPFYMVLSDFPSWNNMGAPHCQWVEWALWFSTL